MYGFTHKGSTVPSALIERQREFYPRILRDLKRSQKERRQTKSTIDTLIYNHEESLDFVLYDTSIWSGLMNASNKRCAFCESANVESHNIHHFRPAQYTRPKYEDNDTNYYEWFAFEWTNLFPICERCKPKDSYFFPLLGEKQSRAYPSSKELDVWHKAQGSSLLRRNRKKNDPALPASIVRKLYQREKPALLPPGAPGFLKHFSLTDKSRLQPLTNRAEITIDHFNLNHDDTVEERHRILQGYEDEFMSTGSMNSSCASMPFGGAWLLHLRNFVVHDLKVPSSRIATADDILVAASTYNGPETLLKLLSIEGQKLVEQSLIKGRKNTAINTFRSDTNNSLRSAKQAVEYLIRSNNWVMDSTDDDVLINEENVPQENDSNFLTNEEDIIRENEQTFASTEELIAIRKKGIDVDKLISAQPLLQSINIENFKSLETISFKLKKNIPTNDLKKSRSQNPSTPCLLLLGENANGKSSFLEALTLTAISDEARSSLTNKLNDLIPKRLVTNTKYLGDDQGQSKEVSRISLGFKLKDGTDLKRKLTISTRGRGQIRQYGDIENILVFAFGAHRIYSKDEVTSEDPAKHVITLFEPRAIPIDPEKWIISLSKVDRNELVKALREVIQVDGEFSSIDVVEEDGKKQCIINLKRTQNIFIDGKKEQVVKFKEITREVPTPFSYASSGYRVIIALICAVIRGIIEAFPESSLSVTDAIRFPVLVIIDEIEVHLHPRWKMEVIAGLRRALPNATFVMSSHDPLCIRGTLNGEVIVFNRFHSNTKKHEAVEINADFPDFDKMSLEDLLTSDLFQMFSTNDREVEQNLNEWAHIQVLKKQALNNEEIEITEEQEEKLRKFEEFIRPSLPAQMTDVSGVIQEAVAQYILERRKSHDAQSDARKTAISEIKAELRRISGEFDA